MNAPRRIAIATGTRAEFGLLRPVLEAIDAHPELELLVYAAGAHLLPPERTIGEVRAAFPVAAEIPMQDVASTGRLEDAAAFGRGVLGFTEAMQRDDPDVVLVLGDRIEAFAAASAAAIGGVRVAHMHGGDVAEGIADESMRHAITKLAHIHLPATARSAERIIAMGEQPARTHLVGSPAIDGLGNVPAIDGEAYEELGAPDIVVLLHPSGDSDKVEREHAEWLIALCHRHGRTLVLHPNHDPGRDAILAAIESAEGVSVCPHLPREKFIGLLRRVRVLVGNSSAGLIECAAIPCRVVNIGPRQRGRQRAANVLDCPNWDFRLIEQVLQEALVRPMLAFRHPFGDGHTGPRTADILAGFAADKHAIRKRITY
jgi:UDP-hydrolysing UDP-N-acetyl-D-glucosamine 2-epimerase